MSHHDKFWEKFGRKIRQYQPEGQADGKWKDMEQLLNGATQPPRRKNRAIWPLILTAAVVGYLAGAWYGWPSTPDKLGAFPIPIPGIAQEQAPVSGPGSKTSDELALPSSEAVAPIQLPIAEEPRRPLAPVSSKNNSTLAANGALNLGEPHVEAGNRKLEKGASDAYPGTISALGPKSGKESVLAATVTAQNRLDNSNSVRPLNPVSSKSAAVRNPIPVLSRLPVITGALEPHSTTGETVEYIGDTDRKQSRLFGGLLLGSNLSAIGPQYSNGALYPFGGLFAGLKIGRRWALQVEAQIKYNDGLSVAFEQTERLESNNGFFFDQSSRGVAEKNYFSLEIPFVVKYSIRPAWNVLAGISPSFIRESRGFSARMDVQAGISNSGQSQGNSNSEPPLRQFDLGVSAGLEWAFHRNWSVGARFTQGLLDLSPDGMFQEDVKHLNTSFQLSARYKF